MTPISKRLLSAVLAAAMLFSLAGCASKEEAAPEEMPVIRDDERFVPDLLGAEASPDVFVSGGTEYQTIRGFGGINYPGWIEDLSEEQRETAFGNGVDQLGFTILRIHIDPDRNNWQRELETAKAAQEQGAIIFASPWNPPADMCEKFTHGNNSSAQRLRHDKYAEYAAHLNDFVSFMRENGVELYAVSIQNEPDYADEWTWWSTEEILDFIKNYADDIDCRLMTPESFQYRKDYYNAILNDEEALSKIDIFATHFYGTQRADMSYPLFEEKGEGKELWMTEVYVPNSSSDADTYPEAVEVAVNIHDALTAGNMQAYVWWYIRRSYGPMKEDGTISKRGCMMAQYSKFVRPGYVRISATENPTKGVSVSAFKGDGKTVIVAVNHTLKTVAQGFLLSGCGDIGYIEAYTTNVSENLARTGNIAFENGSFSYVLKPESVTTFVISGAEPEAE